MSLAELANLKKKPILQILWTMAYVIQVFGIVISGSVTAYLGFLLGSLLIFLNSRQLRSKVVHIALPLFLVGSFSFIILFIAGLIKPSADLLPKSSVIVSSFTRVQDITATGRAVVYKQALLEISQSPFVGVGYDQISTSGIEKESRDLNTAVHNALLQIFYTGGLLSFAGWFAIYLMLARDSIKLLLSERGKFPISDVLTLSACVLAVLLMDQFQDSIYQREKWIVFGLFAGLFWNQIKLRK
jgi:O-antigen ligase